MSSMLVGLLESFLGENRKYNEDTGQVSFDCPACSADKGMSEGDGKGNLEVNYNKGVFKCWSCQDTNNMHGPVIKLLKKYGNPQITKKYLLIKPEADLTSKKKKSNLALTLPEGYKKLSECTDKDYKAGVALSYLRNRGITDEIIKDFEIGYTNRGKFFNRIIIPSYDPDRKLNYFIARWFAREYTKLKYLNPDEEKQEIIFNEGRINWDATIYLVEGATDHIVTPNSIPLLGKFLPSKLLDLLYDRAAASIVVCLDDDAKIDSLRLFKELNFGNLRDRIKVCFPPDGHDPSSIFQILGSNGIIKLLKLSRIPTDYELSYLF